MAVAPVVKDGIWFWNNDKVENRSFVSEKKFVSESVFNGKV